MSAQRQFAFVQSVRLLELGTIVGQRPEDRLEATFAVAERIATFLGADSIGSIERRGPIMGLHADMAVNADAQQAATSCDPSTFNDLQKQEATIFDSAAMSRWREELVDIVKGAEIKAQSDAPCGALILIVEKPIAAELFHALMCQRDRHCARMGESLAWNPDGDERLRFLDGAIRLVQAQLFGPSPL
ncbi:MAG: hypothetical protein ABF665_09285 [Gluconacetobacter sp.]